MSQVASQKLSLPVAVCTCEFLLIIYQRKNSGKNNNDRSGGHSSKMCHVIIVPCINLMVSIRIHDRIANGNLKYNEMFLYQRLLYQVHLMPFNHIPSGPIPSHSIPPHILTFQSISLQFNFSLINSV